MKLRGARLPLLQHISNQQPGDLRADVLAGLTTAAMLVPQGMGYAMLAGLPPVVGLYASTLPLFIYALLGTSRQLAVGPVAMDSLLVALAVGAIAETGTDAYLAHATLLALMVGVIHIAFGMLGLGFVANFLSRPVLTGFTFAAALIIAFSQLRHALLVDLPRTHDVIQIASRAAQQMDQWHLISLAMVILGVAFLVLAKRFAPRMPRALLLLIFGTLAVMGLDLTERGVQVVGSVPGGLPGVSLPTIDPATVIALIPSALTIALIAFVEAISVGKHFARLGNYTIEPGQELLAIGTANVATSLVGGYPITGGFSRTAINAQAGARSPIAGLVTGAAVVLTLLLLTPLFARVPTPALAAIIMAAVFSLFDAREPARLWRVKRVDFWLLLFTFGMTLTAGIQYGILLGVLVTAITFLVAMARPHVAVLGRVPNTEEYLNVQRHPHVTTHPGLLVLRVDAQFFFGNVSFLRDTLQKLEAAQSSPLRAVVLEASGMNQIDSSAEAALGEIDRAYAARGVRMFFSRLKGPVRDVMHRSGLLAQLSDESRVFLRTHDAVLEALDHEAPRLVVTGTSDPRAPADQAGCGPLPALEDDEERNRPSLGAWI